MTSPARRGARSPVLLLVALLAACGSGSKAAPPEAVRLLLHYHRALGDYDGWAPEVTGGTLVPVPGASRDGFGATFAVDVTSGSTAVGVTMKKGAETDAAGTLSVDVSGSVREAWIVSGWAEAITRALPALPASADQAVLYYVRPDGNYTGWGLHHWGEEVDETQWATPLQPTGAADPEFGVAFVIPLRPNTRASNCPADRLCFIVHKGSEKDPGPDVTSWDLAALGNLVFVRSGSADPTAIPRPPGAAAIEGASAHLLSRDTVAWDVTDAAATSFELRWSATADIAAAGTDVVGGSAIPLTSRATGLTTAQRALAPHLRNWRAFDVAAGDLPALEQALKGQLVAVARKADGSVLSATQVQTAFALDDLYAYAGPLGVTFATVAGAPSFALWAPTAQSVSLRVYGADKAELAASPVAMTAGPGGVWTASGPAEWYGLFYRYEVVAYHPASRRIETMLATDPWAVNLSTNGTYAQVVDLADAALAPAGWDALQKPAFDAPEDAVVYEGHIRDFSATDDSVPAERRGKYLAFAADLGATAGRQHLTDLAAAGLTHLHLLPAFDVATIDERAPRIDLGSDFSALCAANAAVPTALCGQFAGQSILAALQGLAGDSDQQQAIAGWMRAYDSFNWGYDPVHYGAPEGSYASAPEGTARIVEFRRMVMGIADLGLRTVMDVVYNHTNASGLQPNSILDRVVPGYYHRLNAVSGFVESSSCCANTATEHRMMERLMVDTLVRWARDYKVDGFRFDLMGLHMKSNLLAVQAALAALTPGTDGVDGSRIFLYGEGWDMGEVALQARGVNATQRLMAGTGIGTFNDRIRDGVRGGGPFDSGSAIRKLQGFASGLYLAPNELAPAYADDLLELNQAADRIKIGMAGNLLDFRLQTAAGTTIAGGAVGYNGQPCGYTQDPQESVNYVSAHDNQTLWDVFQYKLPTGLATAERARAHAVALDLVLLGQGVPFVPMGEDLLRSKSMERDSYDSGDWFNRVDWTGQTTAYAGGLPNEGKDFANWDLIRTLFADATTKPAAANIAAARSHFREMLQVRKSSPLFRLRTKAEVLQRVDFLNTGPGQVPGVIVMTIADGTHGSCSPALADLDPSRDGLVVVVNADDAEHAMTVPGATGAQLHAVLQASADAVVRTASASGELLTVPARTAAVFELPQGAAPGAGLPCNTR